MRTATNDLPCSELVEQHRRPRPRRHICHGTRDHVVVGRPLGHSPLDFLKAWHLAVIPQLTGQTFFPLSEAMTRAMGLLRLAACLVLLIAAALRLMRDVVVSRIADGAGRWR